MRIIAALVLAAALAGPALAQAPDKAAQFAKADADKDGKLTATEWKASLPKTALEHADDVWKRMDPDHKGFLTKEQFVAFTGAPQGLGTKPPGTTPPRPN